MCLKHLLSNAVTNKSDFCSNTKVSAVKDALQTFGIETQELDDPSALLDGGDIIFTGELPIRQPTKSTLTQHSTNF